MQRRQLDCILDKKHRRGVSEHRSGLDGAWYGWPLKAVCHLRSGTMTSEISLRGTHAHWWAMGFIYRLLFPSGKSYVGQTIRKRVSDRWRAHKNRADSHSGSCRALNNAIRKYGWESIEKSVLACVQDSELDRAEVEFIAKFDTYHNGYNLTPGGDVNPMKVESNRTHHKKRLKETGHAERTSKAIRKFHNNKEKHESWLDSTRQSHRTQEHRDAQSARSKKMWQEHKAAGKDRGSAISAGVKAAYARKRAEKASRTHPGSQYAASCASTQKRESVHKLGCIPGKEERQTSSTMTSPCAPRSPSRSTSMEDWEEIVRRGRAPRRP